MEDPSGRVKIVELLIKKSAECNIDLNAKDTVGNTGFHYVCLNSENASDQKCKYAYLKCEQVKKLILDYSAQFNIDLN